MTLFYVRVLFDKVLLVSKRLKVFITSIFFCLLPDYSINAPPTFKPTKKYSDISGLPAPYVDRHSKLYYSNADEFATVRSLPMDITAGYLQLRGANIIVG